jgi:glycosyltransferase involved in cell wall biosynthesis
VRLIVLDAAGVPDGFSGERTRLRGLLAAYGRLPDAPELLVRLARGSTLLEGVQLGAVRVEEVEPAGGPVARALRSLRPSESSSASAHDVTLWHSETIPPLAPRGVPALLTLHDLRWHEPREATGAPWLHHALRHAAARRWLPRVARRLAGVVTVSRATSRLIVERLGVPEERVSVVANAVDATAAAALPDEATRRELLASLAVETRGYFVAVGRLEGRKGLELAIDALAAAPQRGALPKSKLVLVGDGPSRDSLARRARERGLAERVVFPGVRDDAAVAALIAEAAALLFPSRVEGFGFPVYDALARGTPALASELPCLEELAALSPRGLTLLPRDVAAWRAALERELADATRAPPRAALPAKTPTWDDAARTLAELYRRAARTR